MRQVHTRTHTCTHNCTCRHRRTCFRCLVFAALECQRFPLVMTPVALGLSTKPWTGTLGNAECMSEGISVYLLFTSRCAWVYIADCRHDLFLRIVFRFDHRDLIPNNVVSSCPPHAFTSYAGTHQLMSVPSHAYAFLCYFI